MSRESHEFKQNTRIKGLKMLNTIKADPKFAVLSAAIFATACGSFGGFVFALLALADWRLSW